MSLPFGSELTARFMVGEELRGAKAPRTAQWRRAAYAEKRKSQPRHIGSVMFNLDLLSARTRAECSDRSVQCEGSRRACQAEFNVKFQQGDWAAAWSRRPPTLSVDVRPEQPEARPSRIEDGGEAAVRRVLAGPLDGAAELLGLVERRIDVVDGEVDRPLGALGELVGPVHDPRERALALAEGRVAELVGVPDRVRVPAEDVPVEGDALVVVARVELEPGGCAGLTPDLEATHLARLPGADRRSAGIGEEREAAVLGHVHRLHVHLAAVCLRGLGGAVGVVRRPV